MINVYYIVVRNQEDYGDCIFCDNKTIYKTVNGSIPCCPICAVKKNDSDLPEAKK